MEEIANEEMHPAYKAWILEGLIAGCSAQQLKAVLVEKGAPASLAEHEIALAQTHPYNEIIARYIATLQKREGLLKTLDYYQRQHPDYFRLERQPLPAYQDFLKQHLYINRPGLFSHAFDHWPARQWTPQSILEKVGTATPVQVQQGRTTDAQYEQNSNSLRQPMAFGDFIDIVEHSVTNDVYMTANNLVLDSAPFAFMAGDIGNIGDGYIDRDKTSSHMFLWMGPAGIVTPMHHDLTHNLFFQIYGRKRFLLYPPTQTPYMYNSKWVFSPVDPLHPDLNTYPLFAHAQPIEIVVEAGDMLYIPMGWWHHVVGETASISVSMINLHAIDNRFVGYPTADIATL